MIDSKKNKKKAKAGGVAIKSNEISGSSSKNFTRNTSVTADCNSNNSSKIKLEKSSVGIVVNKNNNVNKVNNISNSNNLNKANKTNISKSPSMSIRISSTETTCDTNHKRNSSNTKQCPKTKPNSNEKRKASVSSLSGLSSGNTSNTNVSTPKKSLISNIPIEEYQGLSYLKKGGKKDKGKSDYGKNDYYHDYHEKPDGKKKSIEKDFRTKYKTERCKFFEVNKECKYGENVINKHII